MNPFKHLTPQQLKKMNKLNNTLPKKLTRVSKSEWPEHKPTLKMVWLSRYFVVQVFSEHRAIRLSINRSQVTKKGEWKSNITWDELQQIKHDCGYGHCAAVEIYPADDNVVNVANMRHLWIPDNDLGFGDLC